MNATALDTGYHALSNGAAILDRSHLGRVVAIGTDALDLINRFSTNETVGLSDGDVVVTALTTDIGRVLELITVVRRTDSESLILTGEGAEETVVEWLDRYNFGEDCELTNSTALSGQISLSGPGTAHLGIPLPVAGRVITAELGGVNTEIAHVPGPSLPSFEVLISDRNDVAPVREALLAAGAVPADEEAFDTLRIEHGLPARYAEITGENNPLEAGLEAYVSFSKGCYLGQEVIARLDTYDKIQRRLVGIVSKGAADLSVGEPLRSDDREIGKITSVASSPRLGRQVALGYVRKGFVEPGTTLEIDGGTVEVTGFPIDA